MSDYESKLKTEGYYTHKSGIPRVDNGFSLKQLRKYMGMPEQVKKKAQCSNCRAEFQAWYEGTRRIERYCEKCRRQIKTEGL